MPFSKPCTYGLGFLNEKNVGWCNKNEMRFPPHTDTHEEIFFIFFLLKDEVKHKNNTWTWK